MLNWELSPALKGKYRLDKSQTNPCIVIVGFGDIDLRTASEHTIKSAQELGYLTCLKPIKKP